MQESCYKASSAAGRGLIFLMRTGRAIDLGKIPLMAFLLSIC